MRSAVLALAAALTQQDCDALAAAVPKNRSELSVRFTPGDEEGTCVVECTPGNATIPCTIFAQTIPFELSPDLKHFTEWTVSAPGAGVSDAPEMVLMSCEDFFLYGGWDRGLSRTPDTVRTQLVLRTPAVVAAFERALQEDAAGRRLASQDGPGLTSADCSGLAGNLSASLQGRSAAQLPVRFNDEGTCTVECDSRVADCQAIEELFWAGVLPQPAGACQGWQVEARGSTEDNDLEMEVVACPDWMVYMGWDRRFATPAARTPATMRQEVTLRSAAAVATVAKAVHDFVTPPQLIV